MANPAAFRTVPDTAPPPKARALPLLGLRSLSLFTLSRYAEFGLQALILIHFANAAGPERYGQTARALLFVTYTQFLVFGVNGAYVKLFSLTRDEARRHLYSSLNILFNGGMGVVAFGLVLLLLDATYALPVAAVCLLNLLRGSLQSILRASLRTVPLAVFNLSFAGLFALAYGGVALRAYHLGVPPGNAGLFAAWSGSLLVAILLGAGALAREGALYPVWGARFPAFVRTALPRLLGTGIQLALLTFLNIVFLSADRLLLIRTGFPDALVGEYQYADTVTQVFFLGSNAILYMLTPLYMRRLGRAEITIPAFLRTGGFIALGWIGVMLLFVGGAAFAVRILSPEYELAWLLLGVLALVRYGMLIQFVPTTVFITAGRERTAIAYAAGVLVLVVGVQAALAVTRVTNALFLIGGVSAGGLLLLFGLCVLHILRHREAYAARIAHHAAREREERADNPQEAPDASLTGGRPPEEAVE